MFLKVFPHLAEQRAMFWASSWKIFVVSLKPEIRPIGVDVGKQFC